MSSLLAKIDKAEGVPSRNPDQPGGGWRHLGNREMLPNPVGKRLSEGMIAHLPKPVLRIAGVRFPPVHDAVPPAPLGSRHRLAQAVRSLEKTVPEPESGPAAVGGGRRERAGVVGPASRVDPREGVGQCSNRPPGAERRQFRSEKLGNF